MAMERLESGRAFPASSTHRLRASPRSRRTPSNLWTPTSQRGVQFNDSVGPESVIYAGQGPPPPSPLVVERFQQVISQLFSQASRRAWCGSGGGGGEWHTAFRALLLPPSAS